MQQTAIKIFVLLLNCLVVFGLSFFKPDVDLNQDEDLSLMHDRLNQANEYYGSPSKPELSYYSNSIPTWSTDTDNLGDRLDSSDKDELSDKRALEHQFFGSRGKRFGLSLFMPTRYSRRFSRYNTQSNPRKRYHPKMFVSMRGKRLDDSKFADSDGDYLGMSDGLKPEKRWQGFTALRGKRSVKQ